MSNKKIRVEKNDNLVEALELQNEERRQRANIGSIFIDVSTEQKRRENKK